MLEVVAYHGRSRAMEIRTVKIGQMSHLYVVILFLLHIVLFDGSFCYTLK